ncbi:phospholipase C, phosphocholine-specific [Kribbella antibiotica]|uniref:phospholipase C n=1 Tax=Kribbella antibiotica TaxID=190195 RepID=A0A4R4YZ47_9ACTN|nr:phospholipase C, phosphocholine-specific [Kribbella antibiotica]TDD50280.1 phospholipase C, phosphocholine-specific [Kribbella antibiotica]
MTTVSRRTVLGSAVGASVLAALPSSLQQALAAPARPGRLEDIEHVVILMQENRSFDHYFGTTAGVRGFGDRTGVRGVNGLPVGFQPDPSRLEGWLAPFSMNAAHTNAYRQGAADFGYTTSMGARADGIADGYVTRRSSGWLGQGFYEPADMPFYDALTSVFTVCDAYHCSIETSTNPNREHFMTGTSGGTVRDLPVYDNTEISGGYEWTTYAERLEAAGVSWKTYQALDNFDDNALAWFTPFVKAKPGESLYERGMRMVGDGSQSGDPFAMGAALVKEFAADVQADKLPQVSWLVAPAALSEHAAYTPPNGEHLTAQLLSALADNPAVWAKTAFILNYDEHGGFFDHDLPPVPPLGNGRGKSTVSTDGELVVQVKSANGSTAYRLVNQRGQYRVNGAWVDTLPTGETRTAGPTPLGLGIRVPMLVVSPWSRGGAVDSTVYDHTSVIQFLERRFGVHEPNISPWRRAITGDLVSAFDFSGEDPAWPTLPDTSGNRKKSDDAALRPAPTVPIPQVLPRQRRGTKTLRPLPYALTLTSRIRRGKVELGFGNNGDQAAVLAVYPEPGVAPRNYTVGGDSHLSDEWSFGATGFDLRVHGPAGALWHLRGRNGDLNVELLPRAGVMLAKLSNSTRRSQTFQVGDLAYGEGIREVRVPAGQFREVPVRIGSHGWYDVAVTADGDPYFLRRQAGRLPSRRAGKTDPALGLPDPVIAWLNLPAPLTGDRTSIVPGLPTLLTAQFAADTKVTGLHAVLDLPAGWTAHAVIAPPTSLAAGQKALATWLLTAPAGTTDNDLRRVRLLLQGRSGDRLALAEAAAIPRIAPVLGIAIELAKPSSTIDDPVVVPGKTTTLTAKFTAADDVTAVTAALAVPAGWASKVVSPAPVSIGVGQNATASWEVTAPAGLTSADPRLLKVVVQGKARGWPVAVERTVTPLVAPVMTGHLLDEDFESLADKLQVAAERPAPAGLLGWTPTPPAGWSVVNAPGMPQGPKDLQGWTFMTKRMHSTGGQDRDLFKLGLGVLAVADPDDWDDLDGASGRGAYDSTLVSPAVTLSAGTAKLYLVFDSHYRQEAPQKVAVTATFDTGAPVELLRYSSDATGNDNAGGDVENKEIRKEFAVPAGARAVTLRFRIYDARNNWYWAVDNIRLDAQPIR